MRRKWESIVILQMPHREENWRAGPNTRLCSQHFEKGDFIPFLNVKKLRKEAVPSLFDLPGPSQVKLLDVHLNFF